jgi:TonB family protein
MAGEDTPGGTFPRDCPEAPKNPVDIGNTEPVGTMPRFSWTSGLFLALALTSAVAAHAATTPPVPVRTISPQYPSDMKKDGISGVVWVAFEVDAKGSVIDPKVVKSTRKEFEQPALDAVRKWAFKPATQDGTPKATKVEIPLQFRVENS